MTKAEIKERKKFFPKDGVERILDSLKKVHGDSISIGVRGIQAVLDGERKDKWGIIDMYEAMTSEVKDRLLNGVTSSSQASAQ
jgi:hypothetical protein